MIHTEQFPPAQVAAWQQAPLAKYGFHYAGRFGEAEVWERCEPPPESSDRLRLTGMQIEPNRGPSGPRHRLTIDLTPAESNKPWRFLDRGVLETTIEVTDATGQCKRFERKTNSEPFLDSGESVRLTIGFLDGLVEPIGRVRLSGRWLDATDYGSAQAAH